MKKNKEAAVLRSYFVSLVFLSIVLLILLPMRLEGKSDNGVQAKELRLVSVEFPQVDQVDPIVPSNDSTGTDISGDSEVQAESQTAKDNVSPGFLERVLPGMLGLPKTPNQANSISEFVKTSELLGPLTPIAMSPFFGITILCGMSQVPDGWPMSNWLSGNFLLGNNPVLKHPATFWLFLLLTIVTSLPRFTKVTKPVAQALDWLESYSGLITSLLIMGIGLTLVEGEGQSPTQVVVQAGLISWTLNGFLLVAAVINFMVVKSVRFLFEMLIWISPIPFVDACFEIANKSICFVLLLIYATSPTLALVLNLGIFVACLFVMNWAQRRVNYHWHIWLEPFVQWMLPNYRKFDGKNLWVYCEQDFAPFKRYDKLHLYRWDDQWYLMRYDWFWRKTFRTFTTDDLPMFELGTTRNSLVLQQQIPVRFAFHRGYSVCLDEIAQALEISTKERVDFRAQRAINEADSTLGPV